MVPERTVICNFQFNSKWDAFLSHCSDLIVLSTMTTASLHCPGKQYRSPIHLLLSVMNFRIWQPSRIDLPPRSPPIQRESCDDTSWSLIPAPSVTDQMFPSTIIRITYRGLLQKFYFVRILCLTGSASEQCLVLETRWTPSCTFLR